MIVELREFRVTGCNPDLARRFLYQLRTGRPLLPIAGAGTMSAYAEAKVVDHADGKNAWTMPVVFAIALTTVVPTVASTGASITEPTYTGYTRFTVLASALNSASGSNPATGTNSSTLTGTACTAGSSTATGWAACDSATVGAGNAIFWGTVSSTVISTNITPTIPAGSLSLSQT